MNDRQSILIHVYQEHATQARQHERHRERLTILFVAIAAVIFLASNNIKHPLPSSLLIVVGIFGAVFCRKHYERNRFHSAMMRGIFGKMDHPLLGEIEYLSKQANEVISQEFREVCHWPLHYFYELLNGMIAVFGVVLLGLYFW